MPWTEKQKAAIGAAIGAKEGKTKLRKSGAASNFAKLSREKLGKMMKEPTKHESVQRRPTIMFGYGFKKQ